ncbi:MAG: NAD+ synthase [Sphingomonadales bacterium]|nr:NAD+ synthase [Sphingomonadales bacterium]
MQVAVVQYNPHIGHLQANAEQIIATSVFCRARGADLVVFPELALCGYPPLDLLELEGFVDLCVQWAKTIARETPGVQIIFGLPLRNPQPFGKSMLNGACRTADGTIQQFWAKSLLPDYDVFDEGRYFAPAPPNFNQLWLQGEARIAVTICEDLWNHSLDNLYGHDPLEDEIFQKADWVLNLAASPYHMGKEALRKSVLSEMSRRLHKPLLYVNSCGAQAELVFDGACACFDANGNRMGFLPSFESGITHLQWANGTWILGEGWLIGEDVVTAVKSKLGVTRFQSGDSGDSELELELLRRALVLGIRDFFYKQKLEKAVVGLSGGIDSALVSVLAAEAIGSDQVTAILLPSPYSSAHSVGDSVEFARRLGVCCLNLPIHSAFFAQKKSLQEVFGRNLGDLTEQNLQSRIRCALLMAAASELGAVLLNTSNKSEMSVGYSTLYGDTSGALSVLGDLFKTRVYRLARHINRSGPIIPEQIIEKAPSAELKPGQADSDDLPPYLLLDAILELYVEKKYAPDRIIGLGFDDHLVHKIIRMVDSCEFKRFQSPPILRVTEKAFGRGRVMPLVGKAPY